MDLRLIAFCCSEVSNELKRRTMNVQMRVMSDDNDALLAYLFGYASREVITRE